MANTLLILGAGPSMSLSTALRFGRAGWRIVLASRNGEKTADLVALLRKDQVEASALTVSGADLRAIRQAIQATASSEHGLSAILYNVGNTQAVDLFALTDEEITDSLLADVGGAVTATEAAAEVFGDRGGSILLAGGGFAHHPDPERPMLSFAIAALRNFAEFVFPVFQAKKIHISILTINCEVKPESKEASDIAEHYWQLVAQPVESASWEIVYP